MRVSLRRDLIVLSLLIILSIFPRLWNLSSKPPVIVDEPANLRDIDKLNSYHSFHPVDYEWGYGQATLVHYPALLLNKVISDQLYSLRLTSVILSLLSLIPFYFIVKKRTNDVVGFCTTLLFSFSYFYLQFSRVGWTNIHSVCLGLFLIWLTGLALEKKSIKLFILSGLIGGLIMFTYRAGEIFIFGAILMLLVELRKYERRERIKNFFIFMLSFLSISVLWILKIANNYQLYTLRSRVVSVSNAQLPYHGMTDHVQIIIYQTLTSIKAWILMLPENGSQIENMRYLPAHYGVVSLVMALLFFIGFIIAVKNLKENYVWLFIYLAGIFFGQIMTVDPPNGSRGLILLPVIYIFCGLAIFEIYKIYSMKKFAAPTFIIIAFIIALLDFYFYTQWMNWIRV